MNRLSRDIGIALLLFGLCLFPNGLMGLSSWAAVIALP